MMPDDLALAMATASTKVEQALPGTVLSWCDGVLHARRGSVGYEWPAAEREWFERLVVDDPGWIAMQAIVILQRRA